MTVQLFIQLIKVALVLVACPFGLLAVACAMVVLSAVYVAISYFYINPLLGTSPGEMGVKAKSSNDENSRPRSGRTAGSLRRQGW